MEFLNWNVFLRIALLLNRWENYRTTRDFEQQLVLKLFAFLFVDGFLWYFLLAFLHIPLLLATDYLLLTTYYSLGTSSSPSFTSPYYYPTCY